MTAVVPINPKHQFFTATGAPLVGGTVDVYVAGSTTRTNTWQDRDQTTLNTNPIVLDARGECTIWGDDTTRYKFVVKDSGGATVYTEDNIPGSGMSAPQLSSYTALRAYTGDFTSIEITGYAAATAPSPTAGVFIRDPSDTTSADNGGTIIVDGSSRRWKRQFSGPVHVTWFGADNTGVTNAKSAFDAAIATGYDVFVPKGTFLLSTGITLSTGQTLGGAGWQSILRYTANGRGVTLGNRSCIRDLKIQGDGAAAVGKASQTGILAAGDSQEWLIDNVWISGIAGDYATTGAGAIYVAVLTHTYFEGGRINACVIQENDAGIVLADAGEYVTVTNCLINRNAVGLRIAGGNALVTGCQVSGNDLNLSLGTGSNEGHGTISGCTFNHGVNSNFEATSVRYGMQIVGCQFHLGNITITDCNGIQFVGCQFNGTSKGFTLAGTCTNTSITSSRWPVTPTATGFTVTLNGNPLTLANNLDY